MTLCIFFAHRFSLLWQCAAVSLSGLRRCAHLLWHQPSRNNGQCSEKGQYHINTSVNVACYFSLSVVWTTGRQSSSMSCWAGCHNGIFKAFLCTCFYKTLTTRHIVKTCRRIAELCDTKTQFNNVNHLPFYMNCWTVSSLCGCWDIKASKNLT